MSSPTNNPAARLPGARDTPIRAAALSLSPTSESANKQSAFGSTTPEQLAGSKNFHTLFARVSPVFFSVALLLGALTGGAAGIPDTPANTTAKQQAASAQFTKAEEQRASLNSKPAEKRTLAEYKQVVSSYRRVYLITPDAFRVSDALLAVADLYSEMGDRFGKRYYKSAADSYRFLLHEYPTSRHGQDAMLRSARLEKDQLRDAGQASRTYGEFLRKYPRSPRRREAQEALAELALLRNGEETAASNKTPETAHFANSARGAEEEKASVKSRKVQGDRDAQADAEPSAPGEPASGRPRVRRISTAATADATRVTIDLEDSVAYTSGRIENPERIFVDLHSARLAPQLEKENIQVEGKLLTAVRVAQNQAGVVRVVLDVDGVKDYSTSLTKYPPALVIDLYGELRRGAAPARSAKSKRDEQPRKAEPPEEEAEVDAAPSPVKTRAKSVKSVSAKPDLMAPAPVAQPTRGGQSTLTRALGLKIGRIVIDAGHGGHDTGTIGPTGLMEKDLCLDVALRLSKIIQQRLPGADVLLTRTDDSFVPLEERTRIANEAKADLFISIHANSSQDQGARGIETYYLNLKGSAEAMEVASRENATSQESVHDLEDLVKKIARSEKIDESREFAQDIQDSLAKRIQQTSKTTKDRGVRKAPFVVLIGADMPSVLTEIAFLSNPSDEQLLKQPEHRQRVAEGLYQGVASYLQSLNSMTSNMPKLPWKPAPSGATRASVEQSSNQQ